MTDDVWKKHLAELYKDHSKKQKDKRNHEPFSNVLGAKNVKGVSSVGIPITGKAARTNKNKENIDQLEEEDMISLD